MKTIRMSDITLSKNVRGISMRVLVDSESVKVTNLVLADGDKVPEHSVPVDVFFYVVEGSGTITVGGERAFVNATDIVLCPANTPMSVEATNGRFSVLNVKTPNPSTL